MTRYSSSVHLVRIPTVIAAVRTVVFYVLWAIFTVLWFFPSLIASLFLPLRLRNLVISNVYCLGVVWLARVVCGLRWQLLGAENIPHDKRGYIIFSKHQSTWETFFLNTLFTPQVPVVKKELAFLPVFGWILSMLHPIFIDRTHKTNALKQVLIQGKERLNAGISISIFPEGTRVKPGQRKAFSRGGAMLACKNAAPAIALALNSGEFWPNDAWIKFPGTISVVISPVIETAELTANQLNDQVELWINQQVDLISNTPFSGEYSVANSSGKRF